MKYTYHNVQRGETLTTIAEQYGVPPKTLLEYNEGLSFKSGVDIRIPQYTTVSEEIADSNSILKAISNALTKGFNAVNSKIEDVLSSTLNVRLDKDIVIPDTVTVSNPVDISPLLNKLQTLQEALGKPLDVNVKADDTTIKSLEVTNEVTTKVSNLSDIQIPVSPFTREDLDAVIQVIEQLKSIKTTSVKVNNVKEEDAIPVKLVDKEGKDFYDAMFQVTSGSKADFTATNALLTDVKMNGLNTVTKLNELIEASADPTIKYKITDVDDAGATKYYGFTDKDGGWYILKEDTTAKTYRYIKASTDYTTNWTGRAALTYDYFYNTFS